ncbi:MAG TPA: NAD(P)-dependent alcohol dehydrogenase [Jiangellales bacterium]|nr:NAD(P)-dependent alcohol dehydrogenase [Jiangellales bacterium]
MADTMRAIVRPRYGKHDVIELRDVEVPDVPDDLMLVRVRAAAVNPLDYRWLTGTPILSVRRGRGWLRPRQIRLGVDYAGVVETAGRDITGYRPGDEVFGNSIGAFAEYVRARQGGSVAHKPAGVSFEQAAAVPVAAVTALQALRDHGKLQPGQRVLVNGAAGGVGTFAIQLAKVLGAAEVIGVCSTRNTDLVRSLGADHVIDYTREDVSGTGERYDVLVDNIGNWSWPQYRRLLAPGATLLMVGGQLPNPWVSARTKQRRIARAAERDGLTAITFRADVSEADLRVLAGLLESGEVRSVIDRRYRLEETAEAVRYLSQGHVSGKLIIIP